VILGSIKRRHTMFQARLDPTTADATRERYRTLFANFIRGKVGSRGNFPKNHL
jgi:hypothetical protein